MDLIITAKFIRLEKEINHYYQDMSDFRIKVHGPILMSYVLVETLFVFVEDSQSLSSGCLRMSSKVSNSNQVLLESRGGSKFKWNFIHDIL